jgi:hypothetical protein
MNRRRDDMAGSGQVSARGPRRAAPSSGPATGEQFAALDVLIGIAQLQDRARREEAATVRLRLTRPGHQDGPPRTDPLTVLLPWLGASDSGDTGSADQDYQADGGHRTKTARRGRVRALGRRTLAFLTIPGARRSAE